MCTFPGDPEDDPAGYDDWLEERDLDAYLESEARGFREPVDETPLEYHELHASPRDLAVERILAAHRDASSCRLGVSDIGATLRSGSTVEEALEALEAHNHKGQVMGWRYRLGYWGTLTGLVTAVVGVFVTVFLLGSLTGALVAAPLGYWLGVTQ